MTYVVQPSASQYFALVERTVMLQSEVLKEPDWQIFVPTAGSPPPVTVRVSTLSPGPSVQIFAPYELPDRSDWS
jgi:hypothetical protein